MISALHPERGAFERFEPTAIEAAARAAAPADAAMTLQWLGAYDGYYYDRDGGLSLPVLRAQYSDGTWVYLDPSLGAIVSIFQPADRVNRWLYHGLHSLDPQWLRTRRPLWDIVVITLSVGGVVGVASSLVPAWRRVRRWVARGPRLKA